MKSLISFLLAFLFICDAAANHLPDATPARFYSGHIGKEKVTACIAEKLESGIYFYQKYGVDISLDIKKAGNGNFLIKEIGEDDGESTSTPVPTWDVSITAKKIQGVMRIPGKNQDVPIMLKFMEERTDGVGHEPLLCRGSDSNALAAKNF